jgi:hypothetical protein
VSQIERRLRQEMHDLAQRIAPGDLRPLRPPPPSAWSFGHNYWLVPAAAMATIALVTSGVVVARTAMHGRGPSSPPGVQQLVTDPAVVAVTGSSQIRLLAATTGRIVKTLPVASEVNGIALTPDAKYMFVVEPSLTLSQVTIATGKNEVIDTGAYPAVSPDSRYLAYATGTSFTQVAVMDLRSGQTRAISLAAMVGAESSLLNQGGLTWLGNGRQIVAVSEPDPVATYVLSAGHATAAKPNRTACGQQTSRRGLCAIVINVAPTRLFARPVYLPHVVAQENLDLISGDLRARASFFIAQSGLPATIVDRVRLGGQTPLVRRFVKLPLQSFAVAMAPNGDRLIYARPGSRPSLWVATVRASRLAHERLLIADSRRFEFNLVAW